MDRKLIISGVITGLITLAIWQIFQSRRVEINNP